MTETTCWTNADPRLGADGECLVAVRPDRQLAEAFQQCLHAEFKRRGLLQDYRMFTVSKAGEPGFVWVRSRYGELS